MRVVVSENIMKRQTIVWTQRLVVQQKKPGMRAAGSNSPSRLSDATAPLADPKGYGCRRSRPSYRISEEYGMHDILAFPEPLVPSWSWPPILHSKLVACLLVGAKNGTIFCPIGLFSISVVSTLPFRVFTANGDASPSYTATLFWVLDWQEYAFEESYARPSRDQN